MKACLLIFAFAVLSSSAVAQMQDQVFTAPNCIAGVPVTTTLNVSVGDSINFLNGLAGSAKVNYFVNEFQVATLSTGLTGSVFKQHVVSTGEFSITIRVITMPGTCFGQTYLLNASTAISELPGVASIRYDQTTSRIIIYNRTYPELCVFSITGALLGRYDLRENEVNSINIESSFPKVLLISLRCPGSSETLKIIR